MKKCFIAVLLIVLTVCSVGYADIDKDILFNGIPWGIGGQELLDSMAEKGLKAGIVDESSMPIWTYDFRNEWQYNVSDTGYYIGYYYYDDHNTKIGGYDLDTILQYAYYDVVDGKLNKPNCHYYKTEISFDIDYELVDRSYEDLKGKLSNLYGEGTETQVYLVDTDYTYTVWKGTNNTAVCLYKSHGEETQFLHLMYGITDIENTLNTVREAYVNSVPPADENDYNGL